jgi:hypothetical protein
MRGRVCNLLVHLLHRAVTLGSKSLRTHDQILLSQIRESPNMENRVPVFKSSRHRVSQLYTRALGSFLSPVTTLRATVEVI